MNIYGIGIDIISNERIKKAIKKNKKVINRIFSNNEIKKCNKTKNRINCLSKKYATKEVRSDLGLNTAVRYRGI